jgi:hypothetical protein
MKDSGVNLRDIEKDQNRKLNQLAFVIWSALIFVLGMLLERILR